MGGTLSRKISGVDDGGEAGTSCVTMGILSSSVGCGSGGMKSSGMGDGVPSTVSDSYSIMG